MNETLNSLEIDDLKVCLTAALKTLSSNRDHLNALDQALGDGDHGTTMFRGSEAAITALAGGSFATVNAVFEAIGSAMMTSMGGASGILFGVWFRAAKFCPDANRLDTATLKTFFDRSLLDLKKKSPAAVGDKTMMDALIPAIEVLGENPNRPLDESLNAMSDAARRGVASTIGMLPRFGRAVTLGERVREAQDPGATSISLFFETFAAEAAKVSAKSSVAAH